MLFDSLIAWGVAGFLALSALAHWFVATPVYFSRYASDLRRGRNIARWVEYSISSSVMIVLIAQITGITDAAALLSIFGWVQEFYERPGSGGWLPFIFGCIAGIVPWVAVALAPTG